MTNPSTEAWLAEARRYAHHIWCYEGMVDENPEVFLEAARQGNNVYDFVREAGEEHDLDRADQNWGIHQDVPFVKRLVWE
jgi:hypothetical protein